jgi:lauroyl/myristoyl acyltransferase
MKYRPKHIAEYILLRVVAFLVCILPYRAALALGWGLAALAFHVFRFRRDKAVTRMRSVFADRYTEREYQHMAWISLRNTVFSALEVLRMPRATKEWCNRIFDYEEAKATIIRQQETGRGGIIALPHMGSWDLGGIAYALNGIPLCIIPGRQRNPLANNYFDSVRSRPGIETFPRGAALSTRKVMHSLRKGRFLAIMPDARMRTPGIKLPLLGGTANLGAGTATFARIAKVPIYPTIVTREGWTRHRIRTLPAVEADMTLDKQADIERMSAIVVKILDQEIQAAPEQWFWFNSRWVLDPVPDKKEKKETP